MPDIRWLVASVYRCGAATQNMDRKAE